MSSSPAAALTSELVRRSLVRALRLDLVGPEDDPALGNEVLPILPSRWYLTGVLVPVKAGTAQKTDDEDQTDADLGDDAPADDSSSADRAAAKTAHLPSSMGLTFLVSAATARLEVSLTWGDYRHVTEGEPPQGRWQRLPRSASVDLPLPAATSAPLDTPVPDSQGLVLSLVVRRVPADGLDGALPPGTRSVSLFVVNQREPAPDGLRDTAFAFQARIAVTAAEPFVPRPDLRGLRSLDHDERIADLQYRDVAEIATGHGVATAAVRGPDGQCRKIHTTWLPEVEVARVDAAALPGVAPDMLDMEALAALPSADALRAKLAPLVAGYRAWIAAQAEVVSGLSSRRGETASDLLRRAGAVAARIERGIAALASSDVLEAFRLANRAVATAIRRRSGSSAPPRWRPFQLAFVLMNLDGLAGPTHPDRKIVDLLFFPTGGGKTEAYLGLAAFTLVHRRLTHPGLGSAGVSVLMRYTLRLLTLDQLGRAATLICALERLRQADPDRLGTWPFEIGLWVGRGATPNVMGRKGDPDRESARQRTLDYQKDDKRYPAPIPLEGCPWCGTPFNRNSFRLVPGPDAPRDLQVHCLDRDCDFRALPLVTVDDSIYRRLPCFLIATVDKFAALPWTARAGTLFGRVERADPHGFYGAADPGEGRPLESPLPPPDLIIQDELHLISGPMGTMTGLYETALDALSVGRDGRKPKIVASTATVRRAQAQIRALFGRAEVEIFPPPGPDRRTSYFAETRDLAHAPGRLYLGIAAQGRPLKVVLLRAYRALLAAAARAWEDAGGARNPDNPADPYMTLLGYFNSLRELGGSRRIISDEVRAAVQGYARHRRLGESASLFASRELSYDVVELTSRVPTNRVAEAKRRLGRAFRHDDHVDVAIATNMISVGLDITRLGLMVVLGQPKTTSEYIQATSRVGREASKPGLVVTLLNVHRPRDRSHYESFAAWHESFYRGVEALSVTPFSKRALDRGLAGALVGLCRHLDPGFTPPKGAGAIDGRRAALEAAAAAFGERAVAASLGSSAEKTRLGQEVRERAVHLLDAWEGLAHLHHQAHSELQYNRSEAGGARALLHDWLDPALRDAPPQHRRFRAGRSLRDVEAAVNLWLREPDTGLDIQGEEP